MSDEGQQEPDQFSQEEDEDTGPVYRKLRMSISFAGRTPKCFDSQEQYWNWKEQALGCHPLPAFHVCTDCTPEYKLEMMLAKRCENPHVEFVERTTKIKTKQNEVLCYTFLEGFPNMERYKIYKKRGVINASDD